MEGTGFLPTWKEIVSTLDARRKRLIGSLAAAIATAATLAAGSAPATAIDDPSVQIIGGRDATQLYPGMAAEFVLYPGRGTALCGANLVGPGIEPPSLDGAPVASAQWL